ncbi:interleukin-7 receptor subunit alpha isoform X2 [Bufo gargarizans]|uniref:interleukin-7 receptor subunit alpha isoform X2 n=1 Tax=Bufo gargarizans TaxID=30331 RepID=UPI001CF41411|nr:interleukin-7 receptor subunit alpha isoform X2 [Bufo gargarizans]
MHASSLALLCLLLLHSSLQQSGDFSEEADYEDHEPEADFACFSKIRMHNIRLLCNVTKLPLTAQNITFKVGGEPKTTWSENKHVEFSLHLKEYEVCMIWEKIHCKNINMPKIAIPDSPINVTISYDKASEEFLFQIALRYGPLEYLVKNTMYHEIVLRKEGTTWPCFKTTDDLFYVSRRNLEYSTTYEARVRSIPTGDFFGGFWSPWSEVTTFQTEMDEGDQTSTIQMALSISIPFFLLIKVILIAVFWKSRIKPFIWPEIPNHKKTLEKFCNKPKQNLHISFNLDYYENIPIHKIDYIKAKEIPEDFHEIGTRTSSMEKLSVHTGNTLLPPAEGSRVPSTNNTGQCTNPGENASLDPPNSGTVTLLPGEGVFEKCNPSNGSNGIMSGSAKHSGNGLTGLCWEDIYIAMSAFKTPSNAVKQVPKNAF